MSRYTYKKQYRPSHPNQNFVNRNRPRVVPISQVREGSIFTFLDSKTDCVCVDHRNDGKRVFIRFRVDGADVDDWYFAGFRVNFIRQDDSFNPYGSWW